MTKDDNKLAAVRQDLITYLRQCQTAGMQWYIAAETTESMELVEPTDAPESTQLAKPEEPTIPVSSVTPVPPDSPTPAVETPKDKFQIMCDTFVKQTLDQIEKARQAIEVDPNIFSPKAADGIKPELLVAKNKPAVLQELANEIAACTQCKLSADRTNTVPGTGNPDANIVFIGEAPGREEDLQGKPFVGRSGKLLTDILKAIGFAREEIFICNILKCRPPNNRDPERDEVKICEMFLKRQLAILQPQVICCLGRVAAQTLLNTRASLKDLRETVHFYEGIPVMATFHPAALLRNPNWKRDTWEDVRKLRALHDALLAS